MSWKTLSYTLTGAALVACSSMSFAYNYDQGQRAEFREVERPIAGEYIVVLRESAAKLAYEQRTNVPSVATVASTMARRYGVSLDHTFSHVLRGFVVRASDKALVNMLLDDRIAYIEENGEVTISQSQQNNATWGLDRVDQRDRPLNGTYIYDTSASNVYTYIVDTGVRASHNDFGGRVISGFTAINDGQGSNDCNGHGTHVAGTVAGSTWGVAKAARIVPVRVLGCNGSGTNAGVVAGMDWVAANHIKPAVANMSLGGGASTTTDNAVAGMRNAGVTVVVAAGNENQNACNVSPARSSAAITVGSTTSSDARSSFSNWGSCVDIFAPGSSITSAWYNSNSATNTISGTSMAAPHVAGVAALYLASNPNASPAQVENAIYNNGSTGKLSGLNGSPNLLAYSRFGGGDDGGGNPPPSGPTELENGVAENGLSGAAGSETFFTIDVPAGASDLSFQMSGGSGDADMYVRFGQAPTQSSYDCRPYRNGNNETCDFASPSTGTYHVMLRGYSSYSNTSLVASYTVDTGNPGAPCSNCDQYSGSLSGSGQSQAQPNGTYYQTGSGTHRGWLSGPSSADFDLEFYRWNGSWQKVDESISSTSEEFIEYTSSSGYFYWRVRSYSGSGPYDLWLQTP
ncbi:S8 family serine peptidase [Wenzhouxiangella marina]|uniref:Alkaline serine protease n=1 Tax=Wenzhouxiangella marina TaxID=1579979 RepID=A0A0K0XY29_9GAMM|nr:S8 family serine peptidase [Wenzhouxiangella marina]AKS42526.1 alkaline serine protease [Wenzhouxiangella marina]MBB6085697.1 serine protease [Wenzhouxiangella marina]